MKFTDILKKAEEDRERQSDLYRKMDRKVRVQEAIQEKDRMISNLIHQNKMLIDLCRALEIRIKEI